ncbi:transposase [Methanobrevibacter sp.]|uniref:transposase n=1 Tax=Methanobrevibacter sp. TaxID=66852 RepID=UPI003890B9E8
MQKEFGERRNYKEIRRRLRGYILIADSGYFSTENLHYLFKNKINALVMPKKLSEDHNNKLRRKNGLEEKRKKSSKKRF